MAFVLGYRFPHHGFVHFAYDGKRQDLVNHQITIDDVRWPAAWFETLTDQQWHDAFRAGGYDVNTSERFIRKIQSNLGKAKQLSGAAGSAADRKR